MPFLPSFFSPSQVNLTFSFHGCAPVLAAEGDVTGATASRLGYTTRRDQRQCHLGPGLASSGGGSDADADAAAAGVDVRLTRTCIEGDVVFTVPELSYRERCRLVQLVMPSTRCLGTYVAVLILNLNSSLKVPQVTLRRCARRPKGNVETYTIDLGHRRRD